MFCFMKTAENGITEYGGEDDEEYYIGKNGNLCSPERLRRTSGAAEGHGCGGFNPPARI